VQGGPREQGYTTLRTTVSTPYPPGWYGGVYPPLPPTVVLRVVYVLHAPLPPWSSGSCMCCRFPLSHGPQGAVCAACSLSWSSGCCMCCMFSSHGTPVCMCCMSVPHMEVGGIYAPRCPSLIGGEAGLCASLSFPHGRRGWSMRLMVPLSWEERLVYAPHGPSLLGKEAGLCASWSLFPKVMSLVYAQRSLLLRLTLVYAQRSLLLRLTRVYAFHPSLRG